MSLVRPVPGFIPPVGGLPAANAIVRFIPPVAGGAAAVGGVIGGAPPLAAIGGAILAGALLGAALEQLWGWANGRRGRVSTLPEDVVFEFPDTPESGVFTPAGDVQTVRVIFDGYDGVWLTPNFGRGFVWWFEYSANGLSKQMYTRGIRQDGTLGDVVGLPKQTNGANQPIAAATTWRFVRILPTGEQEEVPKVPPFIGNPSGVPPYPLPEPLPEPEPLPQRPRQVPPLTFPTIPGSRPVSPAPAGLPTPTTPRTSPPPATLPRNPGFPAPVPTRTPSPTGTQTRPDGTLVPTPKTPVVKTPTDVHVIDGVPIPGNGPRPTPEGTAQELGRLEKKLASLLSPQQASPSDRISQLDAKLDILGLIWETLTSVTAGGQYEISSPCEVDENGDRIERVVTYDGNLQSLGVISNKIDALAALLQQHKDLKQPICRQTPAVGQPVTVNFVQVD